MNVDEIEFSLAKGGKLTQEQKDFLMEQSFKLSKDLRNLTYKLDKILSILELN